MSRLDLTVARCEALFASALQPSDQPDPAQVQVAIMAMVRQYGSRGCAAWVAQEFGDHPDTAPARMRWASALVAATFCSGEPRPAFTFQTALISVAA
jgi:hypothetical protein